MSPDYFEPHIISLVLAWVFSVPGMIALLAAGIQFIPEALVEERPFLPLALWILLCVIVLSPFRYILFQVFLATSYPVQSLRAFFSAIFLTVYAALVFGLMFAIGLGLPLFGIMAIAGLEPPKSKLRVLCAGLTAPVILFLGTALYFQALPYAGYSTHWLNAKDIIRATSGPPEYAFKYIVQYGTPLPLPGFVHEIGLSNLSVREVMRAHVAVTYLGDQQFNYYVSTAYPSLFRKQEPDLPPDKIPKPQ